MRHYLRRIKFNLAYLTKPPWDTGIPAPELVRVLAARQPGKALDIGCGSGTNLLYMAEHGWSVTGIDFAPRAIRVAKRKLSEFNSTLLRADVTRLADLDLPGPFDLALDLGCFHSLMINDRLGYVLGVEKWVKPGGLFLIYAFHPLGYPKDRGLTRDEMVGCFKNAFELTNYEEGTGRPSAWYYFTRK